MIFVQPCARAEIVLKLTLFVTGGGKFAPPLSYFNIAPKRKKVLL